jgi:hypothetical protein
VHASEGKLHFEPIQSQVEPLLAAAAPYNP